METGGRHGVFCEVLNVLASAIACSAHAGSESLVGYRLLEVLARHFEVTVITSRGMRAPEGVKRTISIDVPLDDPNDVGPTQLLRYECKQKELVGQLLRDSRFDLFHRITPSGHKDSLLEVGNVPVVLGPVLGSDRPPETFRRVFSGSFRRWWRSPSEWIERGRNRLARRTLEHESTRATLEATASMCLVGTNTTVRNLRSELRSKCRLLTYAGVEHDRFFPVDQRKGVGPLRLLFVGRIVPYKGVELLLRAVREARKLRALSLRLVGGGNMHYRRWCEHLCVELGISDCVTWTAQLPRHELAEIYRNADLFCMPSIETYGIAILEAMSSGVPPLVCDFNGPGEIVKDGTGLRIPLVTPEQFVRDYAVAIVRLAEDPDLRRELGDAARAHVVVHHSWPKIQSELLEYYSEIGGAKNVGELT